MQTSETIGLNQTKLSRSFKIYSSTKRLEFDSSKFLAHRLEQIEDSFTQKCCQTCNIYSSWLLWLFGHPNKGLHRLCRQPLLSLSRLCCMMLNSDCIILSPTLVSACKWGRKPKSQKCPSWSINIIIDVNGCSVSFCLVGRLHSAWTPATALLILQQPFWCDYVTDDQEILKLSTPQH